MLTTNKTGVTTLSAVKNTTANKLQIWMRNQCRMAERCIKAAMAFSLVALLGSCEKIYDAPEDRDYLSINANYTLKVFSPVLGRTTQYSSIFNADNSNLPLTFKIVNVRNRDSTPSNAFAQTFPVQVWKAGYTGLETSLQAIEEKRVTENHPLFEVTKSGDFIAWNTATNANFLKSGIDSSYLFDVDISNNGGKRTLTNLTVNPIRERPYEPSYHIDQYRGTPLPESNGRPKRLLPTSLSGMVGATTRRALVRENNAGLATVQQDVWVYFRRTGNGKSLTFKFMNKDSVAIDPAKFNGTKWDEILHGFNRQMTTQYVKYDVAYPIPLVRLPTKYTLSDGSQANVLFSYNRIGFNGAREVGSMSFAFNIYQEGDWEIVFFFRNETPKFENE